MQSSPRVIADIGHNLPAVQEIVNQLDNENYNGLRIIWGMVEDKDVKSVVSVLPNNANYYLCSPNISRALKTNKLIEYFTEARSFMSCKEAFQTALNEANNDDLILVGGSTFVVSEIIRDFFS